MTPQSEPEVETYSQDIANLLVVLLEAGCTTAEIRAALKERNRTKEIA
jgi:hypothetical protein